MIINFPNGNGGNQEQPPCKDCRSAYFDLEGHIDDCVQMSEIAAHLVSYNSASLAFAVFHLRDMLEELKEHYYAGHDECREGAA